MARALLALLGQAAEEIMACVMNGEADKWDLPGSMAVDQVHETDPLWEQYLDALAGPTAQTQVGPAGLTTV